MSRTYDRAVLAVVADLGGSEARIERRGSGAHPQLRFCYAGQEHKVGIANTPSDRNVAWLKRRDLRRRLGFVGERRVGQRRQRSNSHAAAPPPCRLAPPIAFPPDWRETLRHHPAYLVFRARGLLAEDFGQMRPGHA